MPQFYAKLLLYILTEFQFNTVALSLIDARQHYLYNDMASIGNKQTSIQIMMLLSNACEETNRFKEITTKEVFRFWTEYNFTPTVNMAAII